MDLPCFPDGQIILEWAILERGIPVTDIHCARDQASVLFKLSVLEYHVSIVPPQGVGVSMGIALDTA